MDVGLPAGAGHRRLLGLRREELAQLAGVSVDYYVRLEQGRSAHVSDAVLDAVAQVLGLTEVEREHLGNLARPKLDRGRSRRQSVSAGIQRLLNAMHNVPALVIGRRMDILAWNEAADAVFDLTAMRSVARNSATLVFLGPDTRTRYLNWDVVAAEVVAHLRLEAGRYPDDPLLASLIGDLSINSDAFRRLWARNDVKQKTSGATRVAHPFVGELDFAYEILTLSAQVDQFLTAYTFVEGSPTDERMKRLLSWAAAEITVQTIVGYEPFGVQSDRVDAGEIGSADDHRIEP